MVIRFMGGLRRVGNHAAETRSHRHALNYSFGRNIAHKQATEAARRVAAEIAEEVAIQRLEAELPKMVEEYSTLVKDIRNCK